MDNYSKQQYEEMKITWEQIRKALETTNKLMKRVWFENQIKEQK